MIKEWKKDSFSQRRQSGTVVVLYKCKKMSDFERFLTAQ
jgi:hypothetical protein